MPSPVATPAFKVAPKGADHITRSLPNPREASFDRELQRVEPKRSVGESSPSEKPEPKKKPRPVQKKRAEEQPNASADASQSKINAPTKPETKNASAETDVEAPDKSASAEKASVESTSVETGSTAPIALPVDIGATPVVDDVPSGENPKAEDESPESVVDRATRLARRQGPSQQVGDEQAKEAVTSAEKFEIAPGQQSAATLDAVAPTLAVTNVLDPAQRSEPDEPTAERPKEASLHGSDLERLTSIAMTEAAEVPASEVQNSPVHRVVQSLDALTPVLPDKPDAAAPVAPRQPSPALPPQPQSTAESDFAGQNHPKIITGLRGELLPNGGTMHIQLDPPELGALQISVQMRDGVMSASFQTTSDDATRLLSHSLTQLKHVLESQGVSVDKLQVQQAPRDQPQTFDDARQQQRWEDSPAQQEQQRREMLRRMWRRLTDGSDPLDTMA